MSKSVNINVYGFIFALPIFNRQRYADTKLFYSINMENFISFISILLHLWKCNISISADVMAPGTWLPDVLLRNN